MAHVRPRYCVRQEEAIDQNVGDWLGTASVNIFLLVVVPPCDEAILQLCWGPVLLRVLSHIGHCFLKLQILGALHQVRH